MRSQSQTVNGTNYKLTPHSTWFVRRISPFFPYQIVVYDVETHFVIFVICQRETLDNVCVFIADCNMWTWIIFLLFFDAIFMYLHSQQRLNRSKALWWTDTHHEVHFYRPPETAKKGLPSLPTFISTSNA